ncbi:hypothetical protein EDD92_9690 [Streptomyces sp. TLI_185]|nr:hypothetical protein EDD92_9690 [Streptomyces sp. TLI_185]
MWLHRRRAPPNSRRWPYRHKTRTRHASRRRSCSWQHEAAATPGSPLKSTCTRTPCAAGAADCGRPGARPGRPQSVGAASDVHRAADRRSQSTGLPVAHPVRSQRSRPGHAPNSRARPSPGPSPTPSPPPLCAAGSGTTHSIPGSTAPGSSSATRTSAPPLNGSWTCTRASSMAPRSERTNTSSPRTRRPPSRPAVPAAPPSPPGQARTMRVNHTYGRGGALAYLAAYDVQRPKVLGRCEPTTGIVPFMAPGRPGHDPGALRQRQARVLGRRQRLLLPRQEGRRPAGRRFRTRYWCTPRSTPPG